MARTGVKRTQTVAGNLAPQFDLELRPGGTVNPHRLVKIAADGDFEQAGFNDSDVIGVYSGAALASGDSLRFGEAIAWGPAVVEADLAITLPARLKAAAAGRVIPLVDSARSGDVIDDDATAGNFGNQPANDGVEIISDDAGDTTQSVTVWYTTNGDGDTVSSETVELNGTTQVALTDTDVQLVLGVELSAVADGTVTVREASANATITTITTGNLTAGIEDVDAASQNAYNVAPTAVASGASTKQVGIIGTDEDGDAIFDSQALNGATAVTFNDTFRTVTRVLVGDVATGTDVTFAVGAEDDENLCVGKALGAASAQGDYINALVIPR